MSSAAHGQRWAAAGLFAGAVAWIANTTLNFALVADACDRASRTVLPISGAMLAVTLAGVALSWRAWREVPTGAAAQGGAPRHMLAVSGVLAGLLFALVILLQGAAGVMFDGCER